MTFSIDTRLFDPAAVPADLTKLNTRIISEMETYPDAWDFPPALLRELRKQGKGIFPPQPLSPNAETLVIPGLRGDITLRILRPKDKPRGAYLHFHSGGWMLGTSDMQDDELARIANHCRLIVISAEYRLAPEDVFPAGSDDCEAAALWLAREGAAHFGTDQFAIGGESAGAHLAALTLLRLRDKHSLTPFSAANLNAGCYDLSMTPSVQQWGTTKLILTTRDVQKFVSAFIPESYDLRSPDVSPLYADLRGLPPALLSVGTRDLLLDDSLFMAQRWLAAGNEAELAITPGGCHVFQRFFTPSGIACMERQEAFLNKVFA